MESSRIFIKGLPPTLTEGEFRKHFSQNHDITDAKIFANRRIGYVGYKTPEDARKAVKYFNKTFIRMSKIGVELARPPRDATAVNASRAQGADTPTARRDHVAPTNGDTVKAKDSLKKDVDKQDPNLKEFLEVMRPKSKKRAWDEDAHEVAVTARSRDELTGDDTLVVGASDDEYEEVPRPTKRAKRADDTPGKADTSLPTAPEDDAGVEAEKTPVQSTQEDREATAQDQAPAVSDADWARSRTSRLLGLLDDDEEEEAIGNSHAGHNQTSSDDELMSDDDPPVTVPDHTAATSIPTPLMDGEAERVAEVPLDTTTEAVHSSMRLFVRNLPYDVKVADLEAEYEVFGNLEEVHLPLDKKTGTAKGFAYIQFSDPQSAETAMLDTDGRTFQGRLIHVLPAQKKRETKLDEFELSRLPLKKQQDIKRRRDAASSTFNWNALYMNADAVVSSVANRLGLAKSDVIDPTSSDAAIRQAHAETHIIQETKTYFKQHGIDLDAFKKSQRGDDTILVKNITYDTSEDELRRLFEEHGELKRFLMPPSGTIAIIQFANAAQCKAAFGALAYRKLKGSVIFLEKAPKALFEGNTSTSIDGKIQDGVTTKTSAAELKTTDNEVPDTAGSATLFVRNLNFSTKTPRLTETFQPLEGFLSAPVKTKIDPKKPDQLLSMGFGFVEFRTAQQAHAALQVMDGYNLEGHKLQIRASHKAVDAAQDRRRADAEKRAASKRTKVVIKNLPFEATKKDVRALFSAYGQLRSVRVPKKMDRAARGFAFADFTTPKEAESAMDALRDTHLLGRRLVLDFADEEPEDAEAEIEKMQQKVGAQVNKVALQRLTSGGRKKFTTQQEDEE